MEARVITETQIQAFRLHLIREEKSTATQEKYLRDVRAFCTHMGGSFITKEAMVAYKQVLYDHGCCVMSINFMSDSMNNPGVSGMVGRITR